MTWIQSGAALLLLLLSVSLTHGHGFSVDLVGNQLVVDSGNPIHSDWFLRQLNAVYSSTHGFFETADPPTTAWTAGDTFRFDILSPLYYSTSNTAAPAPSGVSMEAFDASPIQSIVFDGTDVGGVPGFGVSGTDTHEIQWVLSGAESHLGVYGFKYQISGFKGGDENQPYDPTEAFLIFNTPTADYGAFSLLDAQQAVYAALQSTSESVPEPSTAVAVLLGIGVTAVMTRRRLAKSRRTA